MENKKKISILLGIITFFMIIQIVFSDCGVVIEETQDCFNSISDALNNVTIGQTIIITNSSDFNEDLTFSTDDVTLTTNSTPKLFSSVRLRANGLKFKDLYWELDSIKPIGCMIFTSDTNHVYNELWDNNIFNLTDTSDENCYVIKTTNYTISNSTIKNNKFYSNIAKNGRIFLLHTRNISEKLNNYYDSNYFEFNLDNFNSSVDENIEFIYLELNYLSTNITFINNTFMLPFLPFSTSNTIHQIFTVNGSDIKIYDNNFYLNYTGGRSITVNNINVLSPVMENLEVKGNIYYWHDFNGSIGQMNEIYRTNNVLLDDDLFYLYDIQLSNPIYMRYCNNSIVKNNKGYYLDNKTNATYSTVFMFLRECNNIEVTNNFFNGTHIDGTTDNNFPFQIRSSENIYVNGFNILENSNTFGIRIRQDNVATRNRNITLTNLTFSGNLRECISLNSTGSVSSFTNDIKITNTSLPCNLPLNFSINVNNGNLTLENVAWNKNTYWSSSSSSVFPIYNNYYLDVEVTDNFNNPIENANVLGYDKENILRFNATTDLDGRIFTQILTEFNQTKTTTNYLTNYVINAIKEDYFDINQSLNLTNSQLLTIKLSEVIPSNTTYEYCMDENILMKSSFLNVLVGKSDKVIAVNESVKCQFGCDPISNSCNYDPFLIDIIYLIGFITFIVLMFYLYRKASRG